MCSLVFRGVFRRSIELCCDCFCGSQRKSLSTLALPHLLGLRLDVFCHEIVIFLCCWLLWSALNVPISIDLARCEQQIRCFRFVLPEQRFSHWAFLEVVVYVKKMKKKELYSTQMHMMRFCTSERRMGCHGSTNFLTQRMCTHCNHSIVCSLNRFNRKLLCAR